MPWQGIPLEEAMPACESGDTFTVDEIKLVEKQTSPPDYLTEAELITLMEKHGIGTHELNSLSYHATALDWWALRSRVPFLFMRSQPKCTPPKERQPT